MMVEKKNKSFLSNDIKSHPDKFLLDHLKNVGDLSKKILGSKKLSLEGFIDFEILKNISYLIGVTHDFGKSTRFFQEYINEEDEHKKEKLIKNKPETHHAFISSMFAYYIIREYLKEIIFLEKDYYKYLPIISFLVVKRHHGNLDNADDETYDINDDKKIEIIRKQIDSIDFVKLHALYSKLFPPNYKINTIYFKENYKEIAKEINTKQKKLIRKLSEEDTLLYYFMTLLLYSILLDSDKIDASNLGIIGSSNLGIIGRKIIPNNIVDDYKEKKFSTAEKQGKNKSKINEIREDIYREVISTVNELGLDKDKILSLNAPTGAGKTLTALSFALKFKERLEKEKEFTPRIIYTLPFLSIIDQISDDFNEVLNNPTTDILLKHHHLSDIVYTREDEFEDIKTEKDLYKDLLLIEGWNSEIIVTTFIQFFYSIISNRNKAIRKFHNIVNSIVILDEVQAIPHKYWFLLKESLRFFAEHFNTHFIFVTATQPLIFDERDNKIKSLIKNKNEYFEKFDRVNLILNLNPMHIEKFKEELKNDVFQNKDKDFLIVMNTIESSKEIYSFIKNEMINEVGTKIYYISTNIVPKERLNRIKEIKEKTKERKIIISTQLIEAGVDIDVDVVYRDFAPLDSINQVAGRCNRNFGENKGLVKVFILTEKENGLEYYKHIYESFIISNTQKIFEDLKTSGYISSFITEQKFLELSNSYFDKVKSGMSDDDSNKILSNVRELKFKELSEFKLIQEEPYKVDVFVEYNEKAIKLRKDYENLKEIKNGRERRKKWLEMKKELYNYVISLDKKKIDSLPFLIEDQLFYISNENLKFWYKEDVGFNPSPDASFNSRCL